MDKTVSYFRSQNASGRTLDIMWYFIALDSPDARTETFRNIDDVKNGEVIRERFREREKPKFLYKDGNEWEKVPVGNDLEPGILYVWFTKKAIWEDEETLQNAVICSQAV